MKTKIIAHRGASRIAPENTMPSFKLAYELGAEGIETDVHLTKDNVPVLIHDEHLKRTTNGLGYIKDFTYKQLQQFDAGLWFSPTYAGTTIISLEAFLDWFQDKPLYLNIELKNNKIDYKHLEKIVCEQINHYNLAHRTILSTFNPGSIKRLKQLNDKIEIAFLTSRRMKNLVGYVKNLGAEGLHIKHRLLSRSLVKHGHDNKMAVRVYTVNRPRMMNRCFRLDCDAIITDVPHIALQQRHLFQQRTY